MTAKQEIELLREELRELRQEIHVKFNEIQVTFEPIVLNANGTTLHSLLYGQQEFRAAREAREAKELAEARKTTIDEFLADNDDDKNNQTT